MELRGGEDSSLTTTSRRARQHLFHLPTESIVGSSWAHARSVFEGAIRSDDSDDVEGDGDGVHARVVGFLYTDREGEAMTVVNELQWRTFLETHLEFTYRPFAADVVDAPPPTPPLPGGCDCPPLRAHRAGLIVDARCARSGKACGEASCVRTCIGGVAADTCRNDTNSVGAPLRPTAPPCETTVVTLSKNEDTPNATCDGDIEASSSPPRDAVVDDAAGDDAPPALDPLTDSVPSHEPQAARRIDATPTQTSLELHNNRMTTPLNDKNTKLDQGAAMTGNNAPECLDSTAASGSLLQTPAPRASAAAYSTSDSLTLRSSPAAQPAPARLTTASLSALDSGLGERGDHQGAMTSLELLTVVGHSPFDADFIRHAACAYETAYSSTTTTAAAAAAQSRPSPASSSSSTDAATVQHVTAFGEGQRPAMRAFGADRQRRPSPTLSSHHNFLDQRPPSPYRNPSEGPSVQVHQHQQQQHQMAVAGGNVWAPVPHSGAFNARSLANTAAHPRVVFVCKSGHCYHGRSCRGRYAPSKFVSVFEAQNSGKRACQHCNGEPFLLSEL